MPASRAADDFWELVPDDRARIKCTLCANSKENTADGVMLKSSKSSHIRTKQHRDALETFKAASTTAIPVCLPDPGGFAMMNAWQPQTNNNPMPKSTKNMIREDLFDSFVMNTDTETYLDHSGKPVLLSAGTHTLFATNLEEPDDTQVDESLLDMAIEEMTLESDGGDEMDEVMEEGMPAPDSGWKPHGSKTIFMLDLLDNLPRLRLSDDHLKAIIWVMKECGTPNVSTFSALRKVQEALTREFKLTSKPHKSALENHFYMNQPAALLALDWANPLVRKHIHIYPEVSKAVSETFHAAKWLEEIDLDELSPIKSHQIQALQLQYNVLDIQVQHGNILFSDYSPNYPVINPLRKTAQGRPMFHLRIIPWSDDVSANVSKQYNAHTNIYITNANLPHAKLSQEFFMRFCSTSSNASSSEQFVALVEDFHDQVWHDAYDCELQEKILFQVIPHFLPANNPQQSETCSHIGVNGNLRCRRDLLGGSNADAVQSTSAMIGVKDKIAQHWIDQVIAKSKSLRHELITDLSTRNIRLGDKNPKGDNRKAFKQVLLDEIAVECWNWVIWQPVDSYERLSENDPARLDIRPGDHFNVLLATRGITPHQDTPVETLHTWLLGNKKYVWHATNQPWSKEQDETFAIRLQSSCINGLTIPPPRAAYLIKYKNSLIGKHFKILQQLGTFHIRDLCSEPIFKLWKASGELGAMIWYTVIDDMNEYLHDLQILIDNLLDAWANVDPRHILTKIKLHALVHLPKDIQRFGPSVIFATESFECFNAVFCTCSILSNHLAPSRDTADSIAGMERFKHMVSDGYWMDESTGDYIRGGHQMWNFLKHNLELQRRLGWVPENEIVAGSVKHSSKKRRDTSPWRVHSNGIILSGAIPDVCQSDALWDQCEIVVAQSKDICRAGSWVFFSCADKPLAGRILKILLPVNTQGKSALVIMERFEVKDTKDKIFNMPILIWQEDCLIVDAKAILFNFNAQHDCTSSKCLIGQMEKHMVQERLETALFQKGVIHTDNDHYLLNMHAFHNIHLIRRTLPRQLIAPQHDQQNQNSFHFRHAATLLVSGPAKRAETQEKSQATRERNKAVKEALGQK
ncbi:hypothetical protein K435DRAFT_852192 [Dendrothele bispora CBS 962.96]|uniref:Uncharacterized protein n=1 Tax=Dendrothele bispora (strain CBS 962.96) TaxID=1314807 RepID=A0A4S8MJY7_DENBC|nr:hypothetical protein K435DRAFT_852192 [Dendrothele bispora CBS 962.96]